MRRRRAAAPVRVVPPVNLATIAQREGRLADTRHLLEEAVAIRTVALPPDHPHLLELHDELAALQDTPLAS